MGGYNDDDGASIEITDDVLRTLSNISEEYINSERGHTTPQVLLQMTLQTCAVSSANDNGNGCPIGRGLALNVSSGKVYLAEVEEGVESSFPHRDNNTPLTTSAQGPNIVLRSSRIWASTFYNNRTSNSSNNNKRLHIIHTPNKDHLSISPFFFAPHPYAYYLLSLNDDQLIQLTSTSPEVEKGNFVRNVRKSLSYINGTRSRYVFKKKKTAIGAGCDDDDDDDDGENLPLRYRREGLNGWVAV
jgi:protein N-terminal asparagine amidohydrolase